MKIVFLLIASFFSYTLVSGQSISSDAEIVTVYSQNGKFFLKTVPYDDESPTLRGKTSVFNARNPKPLYEFERGFDFLDFSNNFLFLSNNGETILSIIGFGANEEKEGLKSITIYKKGEIIKSYTESEITGCDLKKERCKLSYYNETITDKEKLLDKKESFLDDYAVFDSDGIVYLTDSKKTTHLIDLQNGNIIKAVSFDSIFEDLQSKKRKSKTFQKSYKTPAFLNFPKLKNGKNAEQSLGAFIGMKPYNIYEEKDQQFRRYSFEINVYLLQNGSLEIESNDIGEDLPKEKILEFFKNTKFDATQIPKVFPKWHISEIFFLRKADDIVARKERQIEIVEEREKLKQRLATDKINDIYIPKDLGDCFIELDKLLSEVDKNEIRLLKNRDEMGKYHFGLGMWMRNNWGLWGGSRLQKYFTDRKITHPDSMSSVILFHYHDWLNGKKETWKDWEKNPKE